MVPAVDVKNPDVGRQTSLAVGLDLPGKDGHTGVWRCNWKGKEQRIDEKCGVK